MGLTLPSGSGCRHGKLCRGYCLVKITYILDLELSDGELTQYSLFWMLSIEDDEGCRLQGRSSGPRGRSDILPVLDWQEYEKLHLQEVTACNEVISHFHTDNGSAKANMGCNCRAGIQTIIFHKNLLVAILICLQADLRNFDIVKLLQLRKLSGWRDNMTHHNLKLVH